MYRDLIINLALLISFLSIGGQLFKNKPVNSSLSRKFAAGLAAGIFGTILMTFSLKVTDTTIIDFRNFAIIIVSLYGGIISGALAGAIIAAGRVLLFGINTSSITAVFILFALVLACGVIAKLKISALARFLLMNLSNIGIFFIALSFLISDKQKLYEICFFYGLLSIFGGLILFSMCVYISRSNESIRKLKESARKDFLTGLNNVREFDHTWNMHVLNAKQKSERLSFLIIDIDHFKCINDKYGHPAGDIVLKELGVILKNAARSFDTVSRNGGEEFSVILPDCPNEQALEAAERIRSEVEGYDFHITENKKLHITVSIGVATYPDKTEKIEEMIKIADKCLYRAKNSGRNRVCTD